MMMTRVQSTVLVLLVVVALLIAVGPSLGVTELVLAGAIVFIGLLMIWRR